MSEGHSRATFSDMSQSTQEDWAAIMVEQAPFARSGGARVLDHLRLLAGDYGGFPVDRLTHCLQTATRAHRDGRSEDYVVMALDRDMREKFRGNVHFDATAEFIEKYDCPAFDPDYDTLPLEFFEPMVMRLFEKPLNSIYKKAMDKAA